ncbi:fungal-specific transcription factor domain-containing protein [Mrakia frigida]|uniref:transcription factor domain-containing protein n=1 Tax=Mrakia frigida TaxID=29902 RepID=UPI003FCC0578
MIWSEVIKGGISAWYQPLLIARRCVERIVGERAMRGQMEQGRLGEVLMYLLKFTLWVDVLGCITLSEETPLYDLYTAVLSNPDSGIDMNHAVGFSNLGTLLLLQISSLASYKRSSLRTNTLDPVLLAARGREIQTNLNTQWLPSRHPSHEPFSTKLLLFQIYLHGAQLYLSSVVEKSPDPYSPVISLTVDLLVQCTRLLPDPQLRRSATFPLVMAGWLCKGEQRGIFRDWFEGLGNEAIWVGNSRPSLWLLENVWARRDALEAMDPGSGKDVDLFEVMRELGWELLLA